MSNKRERLMATWLQEYHGAACGDDSCAICFVIRSVMDEEET